MTGLYSHDGGQPAPLPFRIALSSGDTRTDPSTFTGAEIADAGYTLAPDKPTHDPATQRVVWRDGAWAVEDLPPPPEPQPAMLTRLQFVELAQSAGGMTDAQLVAARNDTDLGALWIKLELSSGVERDHDGTTGGLAALDAKGYLPNGAAAVLAAWPMA